MLTLHCTGSEITGFVRGGVEILPNSGTKSQKLFKSLFSTKETKYNECTNDIKE